MIGLKQSAGIAVAVLVLVASGPLAEAYELSGIKWSEPNATFKVGRLRSPWRAAFRTAADRWNAVTLFRWSTQNKRGDADCRLGVGDNIVSFGSSVCGYSFGATTLAATVTFYYTSSQLISRTEITFNSAYAWQIYDGPLQSSGPDFRRVAEHELGHSMGLDETSSRAALMHGYIGDIYLPQMDDIHGVNAIYGKTSDGGIIPIMMQLLPVILDSASATAPGP